MKFTVTIETDNHALVSNPLRASELGNVVSTIQYCVRGGASSGHCYDHSGHRIGTWHLDWDATTTITEQE